MATSLFLKSTFLQTFYTKSFESAFIPLYTMLLSISLDYEVFNFNDEYYINFILHVENYVRSLTMKA